MKNPILRAKLDRSVTLGAWQSSNSSVSAETLARQGVDGLMIDTQHGSIEWNHLLAVMQAIENGGVGSLIRIGWNSPQLIMRAFDLGALGVVEYIGLTRSVQELALMRSIKKAFDPKNLLNPGKVIPDPSRSVSM